MYKVLSCESSLVTADVWSISERYLCSTPFSVFPMSS